MATDNISVTVLTKGCPCCEPESYVWIYRQEQRQDVLLSLGRMAANPELSLTWFDAARIAMRMREVVE